MAKGINWREVLQGLGPRRDLGENWPAALAEALAPALLPGGQAVVAVRVAARVMLVIAQRGGTRVRVSALERAISVLNKSLPEEVQRHADDEAARALRWLEERPAPEQGAAAPLPELRIMEQADVGVRREIAALAIAEGLDLEMEYHDEEAERWPRRRVMPLEVTEAEALRFLAQPGEEAEEVALRRIRWLMPVQPLPPPPMPQAPTGRVLRFPGPARGDEEESN